MDTARRDIPTQFGLIRPSCRQGFHRAKETLHVIKGLSGNAGRRRFGLLPQAMEDSLDTSNPDSIERDFAEPKSQMARLLEAMC